MLEMPADAAALTTVLQENWYDMVGLSIGNAGATAVLKQLIVDIRRLSRNPNIRIIIGGCALPLAPEAIRQTGADLFALTAEDAVQDARRFMSGRKK